MEEVPVPHALDLERWLLRCLLSGAVEAFDVDADVFHSVSHRAVFETILALAEHHNIVAERVVVERLRANQQYEALGGDQLFLEIAGATQPSADGDWRQTLKDHALARKLIRAALGISQHGRSYQDTRRYLTAAAEVLERVIHRQEPHDPTHIADAVVSTFERIARMSADSDDGERVFRGKAITFSNRSRSVGA